MYTYNNDHMLWYLAQEISQDRFREATQYRRMREACKGRPGFFLRFRSGILLGLARILMGFGRHLERFAVSTSTSVADETRKQKDLYAAP